MQILKIIKKFSYFSAVESDLIKNESILSKYSNDENENDEDYEYEDYEYEDSDYEDSEYEDFEEQKNEPENQSILGKNNSNLSTSDLNPNKFSGNSLSILQNAQLITDLESFLKNKIGNKLGINIEDFRWYSVVSQFLLLFALLWLFMHFFLRCDLLKLMQLQHNNNYYKNAQDQAITALISSDNEKNKLKNQFFFGSFFLWLFFLFAILASTIFSFIIYFIFKNRTELINIFQKHLPISETLSIANNDHMRLLEIIIYSIGYFKKPDNSAKYPVFHIFQNFPIILLPLEYDANILHKYLPILYDALKENFDDFIYITGSIEDFLKNRLKFIFSFLWRTLIENQGLPDCSVSIGMLFAYFICFFIIYMIIGSLIFILSEKIAQNTIDKNLILEKRNLIKSDEKEAPLTLCLVIGIFIIYIYTIIQIILMKKQEVANNKNLMNFIYSSTGLNDKLVPVAMRDKILIYGISFYVKKFPELIDEFPFIEKLLKTLSSADKKELYNTLGY